MKKLLVLGAVLLVVLSFTLTGCDDSVTCEKAAANIIEIIEAEAAAGPARAPSLQEFIDMCEGTGVDEEPWTTEQMKCVNNLKVADLEGASSSTLFYSCFPDAPVK